MLEFQMMVPQLMKIRQHQNTYPLRKTIRERRQSLLKQLPSPQRNFVP